MMPQYNPIIPLFVKTQLPLVVGATIRDGKIRLMQALHDIYETKEKAGLLMQMKPVPIIGPALFAMGLAMAKAAHALELQVQAGWQMLDSMEQLARNPSLLMVRDTLYNLLIPNAYAYMRYHEEVGGQQAARAAAAVAELNGFRGTTWPNPLMLEPPVAAEEFPGANRSRRIRDTDGPDYSGTRASVRSERMSGYNLGRTAGSSFATRDTGQAHPVIGPFDLAWPLVSRVPIFEYPADDSWRSQMMMATWPWVVYDRKPILDFTSWMVVSKTSGLYRYYTNAYAVERIKHVNTRTLGRATAFVPRGATTTTKGREPFTQASRDGGVKYNGLPPAVALFGVQAWVHRPSAPTFAPGLFGPRGPAVGEMAYAQAFVYNANPQVYRPPPTPQYLVRLPQSQADTFDPDRDVGDPGRLLDQLLNPLPP
jgi:hypothetical protein